MNRKELYNSLTSTDMKLVKVSITSFFLWAQLNVQPDPLFEDRYMTLEQRNLTVEQLWDIYLEDDEKKINLYDNMYRF
jgi:hypothetical protein